jgi:hypothetical protein
VATQSACKKYFIGIEDELQGLHWSLLVLMYSHIHRTQVPKENFFKCAVGEPCTRENQKVKAKNI